jgi:ribokinase
LFHLAKQYQKITVLNASPARKLSRNLLRLIDYFIVNETELAFYSDPSAHFSTLRSIIQAARKLLKTGPQTIIVTLGKKGCIAVDQNTVLVVNGIRVKTIDTTAAGDCFVGALISQLAHHVPFSAALRFANQAAALSTTRIGASSSLPTLEEYNKIYPV